MPSTKPNIVYTSVQTGQTLRSKNVSRWLLTVLTMVIGFVLISLIIVSNLYHMEGDDINSHETHERTSNINSHQTHKPIRDNSSDVCSTKYCIEAANYILNNMDKKVDPCENFYEFTCGSWVKNAKIPNNSSHENILRKLQREIDTTIVDLLSTLPSHNTVEPKAISNARSLYQSCTDGVIQEPQSWKLIFALIDREFSGWPLASAKSWNRYTFNLSAVLLKLNQYSTFPFYHIATMVDYNSSTRLRYHIRISPGRQTYNEDDTFSEEYLSKMPYQRFLDALSLMSDDGPPTVETEKTLLSNFTKKIASYLVVNIGNPFDGIVTTVRDLSQTINTDFDFSEHIRRLYRSANVTLTDDDIVIVHDIEAIRNISSIIAQQIPEILQRYMIVRFILSQASHLPRQIRAIFNNAKVKVTDAHKEEPRIIACAKYVNRNMQYAVSKLFINKYYDRLARNESLEIVDRIRNTFINMVNSSTWMDAVSKQRTVEKAQAIVEKVGYPDYLDGSIMTKLESIYAQYRFTSSHMQNVLLLLRLKSTENLQRLREPIIREEWIDFAPTTFNIYYRAFFNEINIPAVVLQPPFFHKDAPKYLNYGAIGAVVGHEIAHGFDEIRRHTDKDGNDDGLWSQETNDIFDKRSKCIMEQYSNYTISQINRQVDGAKTRDENIADNDGLKKAFYAYQKWAQSRQGVEKKLPGFREYSAEQMFFISFGQLWCSKMTDAHAIRQNSEDIHAPDQLRPLGATSNFVEFDRAFSCRPGQANSRVDKCGVW